MQTNQSRASIWTTASIWLLHSRRQYSSALIIPGPGTRQLVTASIAQSPLKLFTLARLKPDYAALPCLSHRNYNKGPCRCFSLTPSASWPTLVLPMWPCVVCCAPLLGTCSNKLSFQRQSSPDLLASPYVTDNKTDILKQWETLSSSQTMLRLLPHGNCDLINLCCFKLLSLWKSVMQW